MSYQPHRRKRRRISEMNVVPYIDVMLVLLIIFMITSPLLTEGINVELPKVTLSKSVSPAGTVILVTVDRDGNLFLQDDKQPLLEMELVQKVRAAIGSNANYQVFVAGAQDTVYSNVVKTIALLQEQADVTAINLITQQ